jgi:hypothetical protein
MGQETVDDFEGVDVLLLSGAAARPDQCLIIAAASCRALSPSLFATGLVFKSSKLIANVTVVWMHLLLKQSTADPAAAQHPHSAHHTTCYTCSSDTTVPVLPATVPRSLHHISTGRVCTTAAVLEQQHAAQSVSTPTAPHRKGVGCSLWCAQCQFPGMLVLCSGADRPA